jgi:hypothetical protein
MTYSISCLRFTLFGMIIVYILQYFITVTLSHMNAIVFYPKYNDISTVLTDYVAFVKYSIG